MHILDFRYKKDYEETNLKAIEELASPYSNEWQTASFVSSHPLLSYRMLRRFAVDIRPFYESLYKSLETSE